MFIECYNVTGEYYHWVLLEWLCGLTHIAYGNAQHNDPVAQFVSLEFRRDHQEKPGQTVMAKK